MPPSSIKPAVFVFLLTVACGGDDGAKRESEVSASSDGDAGSREPSASSTTAADASSAPAADASSEQADGAAAAPVEQTDSGPPLDPAQARARALEPSGVDFGSERALYVIEAACKKATSCGTVDLGESECVDATMSEWALGALFFSEHCIDAQLDTFACFAQAECNADAQCAAVRASRETHCTTEQ